MSHNHTDLTVFEGVRASECHGYGATSGSHRPKPLRYIWHHILPQVCGGQTVSNNLISLCDTCHYSTHALLYLLREHEGDTRSIVGWTKLGSPEQRSLAMQGYQAAVAAGTTDKIPDEGAPINA